MRSPISLVGLVTTAILACGFLAGAAPAHGELLEFFGEDPNGSSTTPLTIDQIVNATAAEASFRSGLPGAVTETFEGIPIGTGTPLVTFSGTTTLEGSGSVAYVEAGTSNPAGRYSVPIPAGSAQYWDVGAGAVPTFVVSFSAPVAAFGFYGVDLGDGGGTLRLTFRNGGALVLDRIVPLTQGPEADGSVLFFGLVATTGADHFDEVQFNSTSLPGQGVDYFGFDNLVVAPEPAAAWAALAAAFPLLALATIQGRLAEGG